jgi:hypothetical protein
MRVKDLKGSGIKAGVVGTRKNKAGKKEIYSTGGLSIKARSTDVSKTNKKGEKVVVRKGGNRVVTKADGRVVRIKKDGTRIVSVKAGSTLPADLKKRTAKPATTATTERGK